MDKNNNTTPSSNPIKNDTTKLVSKNTKSSIKMKTAKAKLWLLFLTLFLLAIFGTYGYFKYHNSQITNLTYLIPTISLTKGNSTNKPKNTEVKTSTTLPAKTSMVVTKSEPNVSASSTPSTPNFTQDSKAYQEFILQLSTKLEQMNKDLSNSKAQQKATYANMVNRFNLIYALENGEVPLALSQQVANNEDNPKLQKLLNQLTKFSVTGIKTKESLTTTFNTSVYQDIYLQSLKATKTPWSLVQYYFAKIILIQNFDNTTIKNKNDIRIKLNNIKFSLEHANFEGAYNAMNTLDSALLSNSTKTWQQQLSSRITAEQAIQILKTYK